MYEKLFTLMIENDGSLLEVLLNDLSYLMKTSHLKNLIQIMSKKRGEGSGKSLEKLLNS